MAQFFLSPAQCRMARALLNWTQPELAGRCDLAPMTISKFEKEESKYRPEARTLQKITSVLEMAGIAFTEKGGVEPISNLVTILEGDEANFQVLDDIYNTLKDTKGEILIAGLSELSESDGEAYIFLQNHLQRLYDAEITERLLIEEGDSNLVAPAEWYRYLPKGKFADTPFQVYANKIAMKEKGETQRIVIIEHERFANTMRALFDIVWEQAKPVEGCRLR